MTSSSDRDIGIARQVIEAVGALDVDAALELVADDLVLGPLPSGQIAAEYRTDGVTPLGRAYENAYVEFFDVHDGRVTKWREYFEPTVVAATFPVG